MGAKPQNRPNPAGHVYRLDGARHRCNCTQVITADTPCAINGIVTQRDGNYLDDGGEGFIEPMPIQFDPRVGMAWALNPKTVIRVAGGSFHDGTGGAFGQQGDANVAYRLNP